MNRRESLRQRAARLQQHVGPEPLAEAAFEWPDFPIWTTRNDPVDAWRVWRVADDGSLLSPFWSQLNTGSGWRDGENVAKVSACALPRKIRQPTDQGGCSCGLRAVQSLTVAYAVMHIIRTTQLKGTSGVFEHCPPQKIRLAVGQVACYGSIAAGTTAAYDWPHTLRAERMRLVSDVIYDPPEVLMAA